MPSTSRLPAGLLAVLAITLVLVTVISQVAVLLGSTAVMAYVNIELTGRTAV